MQVKIYNVTTEENELNIPTANFCKKIREILFVAKLRFSSSTKS